VAPPLRALIGLLAQDRRPARPLALVGRRALVDDLASRLVAGGGERRLLAPLDRPVVSELRRCSAVVACDLDIARLRLVGHARRPWVAVLGPGQDRYAVGALPFLGALNAVPDTAAAIARLVRVLDVEDAAALAEQLPALRPLLSDRLELETSADAALVAAFGRPELLSVPVGRAMLADARANRQEDPRLRAMALGAAVAAGGLALRAPAGAVGRAVVAYAAAAGLVQRARLLHQPGSAGQPGR
jgi:hypothetical protein